MSSDERRNITGLTSLRLVLLVLSCALVFLVKPSALGAMNPRPRRVLILDSFGRDVAPFNTAAAAFRTTSEARLPSASVVQFRQPTFWQQYKWTDRCGYWHFVFSKRLSFTYCFGSGVAGGWRNRI